MLQVAAMPRPLRSYPPDSPVSQEWRFDGIDLRRHRVRPGRVRTEPQPRRLAALRPGTKEAMSVRAFPCASRGSQRGQCGPPGCERHRAVRRCKAEAASQSPNEVEPRGIDGEVRSRSSARVSITKPWSLLTCARMFAELPGDLRQSGGRLGQVAQDAVDICRCHARGQSDPARRALDR